MSSELEIDFDNAPHPGDDRLDAFDLIHRTREELYAIGAIEINPERWKRLEDPNVLRFEDVIADLHGESGQVIRCPFHGRDSKPSFQIYPGKNNAYCFGCPQDQAFYDSVRFTALKLDMTRTEALNWLEKHYQLPPLEEYTPIVEEEEEDDDGLADALNFHDMLAVFLRKGSREIRKTLDPELAEDYALTLFESWPDRNADPNSQEQLNKALGMAQVLGREALEKIKKASA